MIEFKLFQAYELKEIFLSTELFLSCSILQLTFFAVSTAYQRKQGYVVLGCQTYYIGALILSLSALLIINEDFSVSNFFSSNSLVINDFLSVSTKLTVCVISVFFMLVVKITDDDSELVRNNFEYVVLATISVLGIILLCSSNDLITAYLSVELQSVAFYVMATFKRDSNRSVESGLKYFIIGSLSSAFFLFGSSLVYGCVGSLNFDDFKIFLPLLMLPVGKFSALPEKMFADNGSFTAGNFSKAAETKVWQHEENTALCLQETGESARPLSLEDFVCQSKEFNFFKNVADALQICHEKESLFFASSYSKDIRESLSTVTEPLQNKNSLMMYENVYESFGSELSINGFVVNSSVLDLNLLTLGFFLICISLLIKLAVAPFHLWSIDVYEGSPNATTFFFAVIPKIGIFVLLVRICQKSFYGTFLSDYQFYFFLFTVLSIFVGSVGGLEQRRVKSLLAYSSVSHTGYLLLSFSAGGFDGVQMMFYYIVIFMIAGACFWSAFLFVKQKPHVYFEKQNKELGDFSLLKESNPTIAFVLAVTLFSLAGIPPLVGFLVKVGVFLVVVQSSFYLVALAAILLSVVSTFYYLRIIKVLYFENILAGRLYMRISSNKSILIAILSLLLVILCVDPLPVYLVFHKVSLLLLQ